MVLGSLGIEYFEIGIYSYMGYIEGKLHTGGISHDSGISAY